MAKKLTTDEFITRAISTHGDKYDYSLSDYQSSTSPIVIICPTHGEFTQRPANHLTGNGCPRCVKNYPSDTISFTKKAKHAHSSGYSYHHTVYKTAIAPVTITCDIHGDFLQSPNNHLAGHGCSKCNGGVSITHDEFVKKSNQIHGNRYRYLVEYTRSSSLLPITCDDHGDFLQRPNDHLNGDGCPRCGKRISFLSDQWLDSLGLPDDPSHREVGGLIPNRRYVVDGYDPETNTVYEFHGDYWHGNPKIYNPDDINPSTQNTYGQLYENTVTKKNTFLDAGYNYYEIWESGWIQHKE